MESSQSEMDRIVHCFFLYTPDFEITTSPRCHSPGSVICSPGKRFDCVNILTSLFYPACNDNGEKSCQRNNIDGSQESWIAERTLNRLKPSTLLSLTGLVNII